MQISSKTEADFTDENIDAKQNQAPLDASKATGKMITRSMRARSNKSNRSSESVAANVTVVSITEELSFDKPNNSSVKDFDPTDSPDASQKTPFDSDSKVLPDECHDTPHPLACKVAAEQVETGTLEVPADKALHEAALEAKKTEHNSSVNLTIESSKKRTIDQMTGGLEIKAEESKDSKRLKLTQDPHASKKSDTNEIIKL